jgi:hypothetical protein
MLKIYFLEYRMSTIDSPKLKITSLQKHRARSWCGDALNQSRYAAVVGPAQVDGGSVFGHDMFLPPDWVTC